MWGRLKGYLNTRLEFAGLEFRVLVSGLHFALGLEGHEVQVTKLKRTLPAPLSKKQASTYSGGPCYQLDNDTEKKQKLNS